MRRGRGPAVPLIDGVAQKAWVRGHEYLDPEDDAKLAAYTRDRQRRRQVLLDGIRDGNEAMILAATRLGLKMWRSGGVCLMDRREP